LDPAETPPRGSHFVHEFHLEFVRGVEAIGERGFKLVEGFLRLVRKDDAAAGQSVLSRSLDNFDRVPADRLNYVQRDRHVTPNTGVLPWNTDACPIWSMEPRTGFAAGLGRAHVAFNRHNSFRHNQIP
jgi:hypothetical protein